MDKGSLPLCRRQARSEAERPKETFFKLFIRGEMGLLFLGVWSCELELSPQQVINPKAIFPAKYAAISAVFSAPPTCCKSPIAHDLSGKMIALHLRTKHRPPRTSSASPQPKSDLPRQICGD